MIATDSKVIVMRPVPEENVLPGDVATVVEQHCDVHGTVVGYGLKILAADGQTVAVCTVSADTVREATVADRLCCRPSSEPTIDEVRAVRHRISEQFGHDPKRLCEHYMKLQERYGDRLVRSTDRPHEKGS
jgi:hypothetical protein